MYTHRELGSEVILRHFLAKANRPLNIDQIELANVESATSKYGDTVALIKAAPNMGLTGEYSFFYERVDVAQVTAGMVLTVPYRAYKNTYEIIYEINGRYGFQLQENEVVLETYGTQGAFKIVMSDSSPLWKGSFYVVREAAEDSIVRVVDGPPSPSSPLVPTVTRAKMTGDLLYESYNFTPLAKEIATLGTGLALELQVLEFLSVAVADPWMLDTVNIKPFNVSGCNVRKTKDGVWNVLEIELSDQCGNVNGTIRFKYMSL